jgi:hypothetical protein
MTEPVTTITDYMMGAAAAWFSFRLWHAQQKPWSLAFLFTSLASFLGGSFHGFGLTELWKPTVYCVGLASMFLLIGAKPVLTPLAVAKFMVFATWMVFHDDFKYVIIDYGISMLTVAVLQSVAWFSDRAESAPWVVGSICVSIAGAVIQQMEIGIHRHFNHNDLYHVIQIFALWLLYRGGLLLNRKSVTDLPMTQPT